MQEHVDCVQPSLHSDLADEHEHVVKHVEQAGLGHVHHEREVLDAQASAQASSSLGDHARHPLIPPYRYSNKQMASKLSTGSSSNTAVGERRRGPHAPRSSTRARIAATSDASDAANGMAGARGWEGNLI